MINIETDELRMNQVFLNLLSNAIKFTKHQGEIKVECEFIPGVKSMTQVNQYIQRRRAQKNQRDSYSSDTITSNGRRIKDSRESCEEIDLKKELQYMYRPEVNRDKLIVSVKDSGIGIKKTDQSKLFKLFGCLQSTRQMNTRGIGLGLVISKNIVEAFGGSIDFKSRIGVGSIFVFSFLLGSED